MKKRFFWYKGTPFLYLCKDMRQIRPAALSDIPSIMPVMAAAKRIMRDSGNLTQWEEGYPSESVIRNDIQRGGGIVMEDDGQIVAYFAFLPSPEPTYSAVEGGHWQEDTLPYHVIHRIASLPDAHGVFSDMIAWCLSRENNLRIDTHRDNSIMQHCILKAGFRYCGIIHLANGDERLAYQLIAR